MGRVGGIRPPTSLAEKSGNKPPSGFIVHATLICVQVIFGAGAVVGKLGVSSFNPLLFALIREACAGGILGVIALFTAKPLAAEEPKRMSIPGLHVELRDLPWFFLAGFWLFSNQAGFIVGEKLCSAVIGSAWQPSQPLFIAAVAMCLGWEHITALKLLGIIIALIGAGFMVMTSPHKFGSIELELGSSAFAGNVLFFFNCFGTAMYVITARKLLTKYASMTVTGLAYMCAAVLMAIVAVAVTTSPAGVHFVCPVTNSSTTHMDCGDGFKQFPDGCSCGPWNVPDNAILPLLYWILFNSVAAYLMMTWANAYADPTSVLGYTALQPLTSSVLVLIITAMTSKYDLKRPGFNLVGGLLIVGGLYLLIFDNRRKARRELMEAQLLDVDHSSVLR